ncbi:MAG: NAD(P)/FAD-dependent oxidoreductase [Caulobacter sp.]|nr:NAD(P)/FAD-dependent oxidoreductase [Caulobacter sp.]
MSNVNGPGARAPFDSLPEAQRASDADELDVIIVGAGPAGLTAALYLARYRRSPLVLHDGASRALRIPLTHNAPGFPDGIAGSALISRMTAHAEAYGARLEAAEVETAAFRDGVFQLNGGGRTWRSRALVLATGISLHQVDLPEAEHEAAIRAGVLRYCPICDGYEAIDRAIGVIGCNENGAAEALFLRRYSSDITLMPLSHSDLSPAQETELAAAGIRIEYGALRRLAPGESRIDVVLEDRETPLPFDVVYPALGCSPRTKLAVQLGVPLSEKGCAPPDPRSSGVEGLFVAGDVLEGLDQISVAVGNGAVAATHAHNWLREKDGQSLQCRKAAQ